MPGRPTEPLSGRDIEHYAASAMHVYHRGQSYTGYESKAEEIRLLFPNHRLVFVFPWQSAQKKQNFFAVFTSPEAAYDARQQHKAQSWAVEPVDKHKASRLFDLLQRVKVPKPRRNQRPPTGPAATRKSSPPSPSPPEPSPSPSTTNAVAYRHHDDTPPVRASSSIKRSANDAFESSSELEYPSKRRLTVGSSTDVPLAVSTPTPQPEVSGPCPSWAREEIEKLRAQVAQLESKHTTESIEPGVRNLTISPVEERAIPDSSIPSPVFKPAPQDSTLPSASAATKSVETREVGSTTDGEDVHSERDAMVYALQQQLELERKTRAALELELRRAKQIAEGSFKSEAELRRQLECLIEYGRQGERYRVRFEKLSHERQHLQATIRTLEASVSVSLPTTPRPVPAAEDIQMVRGALVAETTRRVNAEHARDEALAAKSNLEARIPAVVQLYQELEAIAAKGGGRPRILTA